MATARNWQALAVSSDELNLDLTLGSGQAFLWRKDSSNCWTGPIGNKLFCLHRDSAGELLYWSHPSSTEPTRDKAILEDYFRLEQSVSSLYEAWSKKDKNFSQRSTNCRGIRLLNQHPLETLVAFISSSNNNIERIHLMMIRLCQAYGDHLGCHGDHDHYTFPPLLRLCENGVEEKLRELGFGYRAKYISQTAQKLNRDLGGEHWLVDLRERPYLDAWQSLQQFPGVGGKVSDCVCLMGLGHLEAVPVDVHISRLAVRDYASYLPPNLANLKSLSSSNYQIIGDHFRSVFGDKAGWAQAVLFAAEVSRHEKLPSKRILKHRLPQTSKKTKLTTRPSLR